MDDDGMIGFDVSEQDIEDAFNPQRRRFQTKNEATYGVFNEGSDDDEDARPSFSKGAKRAKNYSAPVAFVSGGVQKDSSLKADKHEASSSSSKVHDFDEGPIEINFDRRKLKKPQMKQMGANVFAGMRSSAFSGSNPDAPTAWAKHSKGDIIAKMMKNMGYQEGQGLGKDKQGIIEPIQAALRPGRGAVGAYGRESTAVGPKFGESAADAQRRIAGQHRADEEEPEPKRKPPPKDAWKKTQKVTTKLKTLEEILDEEGPMATRSATHMSTKVIDMTGPVQRVYTGYDALSIKLKDETSEVSDRPFFNVPELEHNLGILVNDTESKIRLNKSKLNKLEDETTALVYDLEQMETLLKSEEEEMIRVKELYEVIEKFVDRKVPPTMAECQALFQQLQLDFPTEYKIYDLESLAISSVLPLIRDYFASWDMLEPGNLSYGVDIMREWRDILEWKGSDATTAAHIFKNNEGKSLDQLGAYDRLLWEGWLPTLRRAALVWDPREQVEVMISLIETWIPLWPLWIRENILEQIIIPRISARVDEWDPLTDPVPIHSWLVPWLEILGDRLQPVLSPIRQKLAKALRLWQATDRSALGILEPWKDVWTAATMSSFVSQNIVPKLGECLDKMVLDPRVNPNYEEWTAVMEWMPYVGADTMASIVTKYFFSRWYEVLCTWLDSPGVNFEEVSVWYREWSGRMPQAIKTAPTINENFKRALMAIGRAQKGIAVSGVAIRPQANLSATAPPPPPPPIEIRPRETAQLSLKDMIEMTAQRENLPYYPQPDRFYDNKQVYWFGTVSIYLDRGLVFVMDPQSFNWRPAGLDEVIFLARGSSR